MSTTGDFNLDGTLDIATANADSNSVSVLLANGSGGYAPKADYGTAANCSSVVSADANADGKLDLWTVNANAKTLSLLQGDGLGSFTKIGDFGTGERSVNLAVADVNGDGRMDFVSSNHDTANVTVRFGDGALGFGPIAYYAVGSIPYGLAIADLNLDNKPDIAVANVGSGSVSVLYGTGSGVFGPSVGLPTGTGWQPRDVKITDVNGDGRQDLLVANYSTVFQGPNAGAVAVLLGRNACGFLPIAADGFELPVNYHIGGGPSRVAIGDLDANGTMDVVAPNSDAGSIAVLLNQIAQPAGLALYGAGTSGCSATLALSANSAPKVNHADFALTATNAPPLSLGLGLVTSGQDLYGTDPYGIGVKLHVDLFGSPEAFPFDCVSGPSGTCFLPVPIPDLPQLGGATYFFQTIWIESAGYRCSSSSVGLVSSRGLMLTIQP
jgi:hypothetical protein